MAARIRPMPEFLAAVRPRVAIISSGEEILTATRALNCWNGLKPRGFGFCAPTRNGAIHVITDGERIEISCFVACPGAWEFSKSGADTNRPQARLTAPGNRSRRDIRDFSCTARKKTERSHPATFAG